MGLFKKFVSQTRKPKGFLGKVMLGGMNSGHAAMADGGFSHLPPIEPEKAVDLGCGGGRNAGELLKKYPKAHVTAIDYSDLSVEKAKAFNQVAIAAGRCEVRQGDVSDLRLTDRSFDLATAFETVYFLARPGELLCPGRPYPEAGRDLHDLQRIGRHRRYGQEIRGHHRRDEMLYGGAA